MDSPSLHLSDLGAEEPLPLISVPQVDAKEMEKARYVLRFAFPRQKTFDPSTQTHSCQIQSSTDELHHYQVTISFDPDTKDWTRYRCTCPHAAQFDAPCKHSLAFYLWLEDQQKPPQFRVFNSKKPPELHPQLPLPPQLMPRPAPPPPSTASAATTRAKITAPSPAQRKPSSAPAPSTVRVTSPAKRVAIEIGAGSRASNTRAAAAATAHLAPSSLNSATSIPSRQAPSPSLGMSSTSHSEIGSGISKQLARSSPSKAPFGPSIIHPRQGHSFWKCDMCLTKNTGLALRCRECSAIRKIDTTASVSGSSRSQGSVQAPATTWRCTLCAFENKIAESPDKCKICANPHRPTPPSSVAAPASVAHSAASPALGASSSASTAANANANANILNNPLSLSFSSVPPFSGTAAHAAPAASSLSLAPSSLPLNKKHMSVIPEASPDAAAVAIDPGTELQQLLSNKAPGTEPMDSIMDETEKERRRRAILEWGQDKRSAAAPAASARSNRSARPSDHPPHQSNPPLIDEGPLVISFTSGRRTTGRKSPITIPTDLARSKAKQQQEEQDRLLAQQLAEADRQKKGDDDDDADDDAESKPKSKSRAKTKSSPAKSKRKTRATKTRRKGRKDESEEDEEDDSEYEMEEEKKVEDGDEEMKEAAAAVSASSSAAPAAAAAPSAAPDDADVIDITDASDNPKSTPALRKTMPSFLASLEPKSKRRTSKVAMTGAAVAHKGRASSKKKPTDSTIPTIPEEGETADESNGNDDKEEVEHKPKRKRAAAPKSTSKPKAKPKKTSNRRKTRRERDSDSQEDSEWDGEDLDYEPQAKSKQRKPKKRTTDDDEEDDGGIKPMDVDGEDDHDDDLPDLVDPSTIAKVDGTMGEEKEDSKRTIPASLVAASSIDPSRPKLKDTLASMTNGSNKPSSVGVLNESSLLEVINSSKLLLDQLQSRPLDSHNNDGIERDGDGKKRRRRKINLKSMIQDAGKLYELIQAPASLTQGTASQLSQEQNDERTNDAAVAAISAAAAPASVEDDHWALPHRRISLRHSSSSASASTAASSSSKLPKLPTPAIRAPEFVPPHSESSNPHKDDDDTTTDKLHAKLEPNSDDEIEAGLENLFDDMPESVPARTKKQDSEDEKNVEAVECDQQENAPQTDAAPSTVDPSLSDVELIDDDEPQSIEPQVSSWRKVDRSAPKPNGVKAAKGRTSSTGATSRSRAKKPAAAAAASAASRKRTTQSQSSQNAESQHEPEHDDAAESTVASKPTAHPPSRIDASKQIKSLFPQMTLESIASLLAKMDDQSERVVDWLLNSSEKELLDQMESEVRTETKSAHSTPTRSKKPSAANLNCKPSGRKRKHDDDDEAPAAAAAKSARTDHAATPDSDNEIEDMMNQIFPSPSRSSASKRRPVASIASVASPSPSVHLPLSRATRSHSHIKLKTEDEDVDESFQLDDEQPVAQRAHSIKDNQGDHFMHDVDDDSAAPILPRRSTRSHSIVVSHSQLPLDSDARERALESKYDDDDDAAAEEKPHEGDIESALTDGVRLPLAEAPAEVEPEPKHDAYAFSPSQPTGSQNQTASQEAVSTILSFKPSPMKTPVVPSGWSKKKQAPIVEDHEPRIPRSIKARQLRAQLQQLESIQKKSFAGVPMGSRPRGAVGAAVVVGGSKAMVALESARTRGRATKRTTRSAAASASALPSPVKSEASATSESINIPTPPAARRGRTSKSAATKSDMLYDTAGTENSEHNAASTTDSTEPPSSKRVKAETDDSAAASSTAAAPIATAPASSSRPRRSTRPQMTFSQELAAEGVDTSDPFLLPKPTAAMNKDAAPFAPIIMGRREDVEVRTKRRRGD